MEAWVKLFMFLICLALVALIGYNEGRFRFMLETREKLKRGEKPAWLCRWLR